MEKLFKQGTGLHITQPQPCHAFLADSNPIPKLRPTPPPLPPRQPTYLEVLGPSWPVEEDARLGPFEFLHGRYDPPEDGQQLVLELGEGRLETQLAAGPHQVHHETPALATQPEIVGHIPVTMSHPGRQPQVCLSASGCPGISIGLYYQKYGACKNIPIEMPDTHES